MTFEEKIEMLALSDVLSDAIFCNNLSAEHLNEILKKYLRLKQKFVEQYEITDEFN